MRPLPPLIFLLGVAGASARLGVSADLLQARSSRDEGCRCFPGDACWPNPQDWAEFNSTLGGKLVATLPIGSSCHDGPHGSFDAARCTHIQSSWGFPETHYRTSSSVQSAFFANDSCDPFLPRSAPCALGTYVRYAVDARSAADYQSTLAFSRRHNLRLVIRNTGHDYLGKSTGAGALALWTHHLKGIRVLDYQSSAYSGKALKAGAGVQVSEAQAAAHAEGLVVVGGNCESVGLAGGYTQGGGHGPLSSTFGLSADQVLEWEAVTAEGRHLVATPGNNSDLYWALSGGGGGTYAAVLSVTVKAYPDVRIAAANLTFTPDGVSTDAFYGAVQTFLTNLPALLDIGASSVWLLTGGIFLMQPTLAPGLTKESLQKLIDPTLAKLNESGMPYTYFIGEFPAFLDAYRAMVPANNITEFNLGGRLIPRSLVETANSASSLMRALRSITDEGAVISGVSVNVSRSGSGVANSVHPAWRSTIFDAVFGLPYNRLDFAANVAARQKVTKVLVPKLADITPGGAAYLNEADGNEPNFQRVFYGDNYPRLRAIKRKYDPLDLFYGPTAVGSEDWESTTEGRLCRVTRAL